MQKPLLFGASGTMKTRPAKSSDGQKANAFGAEDFISFIHDWGHPEWVLLAVEAPVEETSRNFSLLYSAKERMYTVPIRGFQKGDDLIAPVVAVVQPKGSPWSVVFRTLCLPIGLEDIKRAEKDAHTLSAKLKTRALAFVGENTSFAMSYSLFSKGKMVERKAWDSQQDSADAAFAKLKLYLPACYPNRRGNSTGVIELKSSEGQIQRADILDIRTA